MKAIVLAFALVLVVENTVTMAQNNPPGQYNAGGLVKNGGFEEGSPDALPAGCRMEKELGAAGTVSIDNKESHSGKQSILIQMTSPSGYLHPNLNATLKPGFYIFRVWAKTEPQQSFTMQLYDFTGKNKLDGKRSTLSKDNIASNGEWNKYEADVEVTTEFPASIQIGLTKPGKLWLDDIEIVPSEKKPAVVADSKAAQAKPTSGTGKPPVLIWDIGRRFEAPLTSEQVEKRDGWKAIDKADGLTGGDICIANESILLVFRNSGKGAELYGLFEGKALKAATLIPIGQDSALAVKVESIRLFELYPDRVSVELSSLDSKGKPVRMRYVMLPSRQYVECEPLIETRKLRVESTAQFAFIPDGLGNDLLVNAEKTREESIRWPSENALIQLSGDGNLILACLWRENSQEIFSILKGEGVSRRIEATEISCVGEKRESVYVAALRAPGMWFKQPIGELPQDGLKTIPWRKMEEEQAGGLKSDWKATFEATWFVDFRRDPDSLIDAWPISTKKDDGTWTYCIKSHSVWNASRECSPYPVYMENGKLHMRLVTFENFMKNNASDGPPDLTFKTDDVAIGYPWEPILNLYKQAFSGTPQADLSGLLWPKRPQRALFPATCTVTQKYEKFFDEGKELEHRREMLKEFKDMDYFVIGVRWRIESYMDWSREMQSFYAKEKSSHPGLAGIIDDYSRFTSRLESVYKKSAKAMRQPADCLALVDQWIAMMDDPSATDKATKAKKFSYDIRLIGGAQDATMCRCRQIVKELRQKAGYTMLGAANNESFNFALEVRRRCIDMLGEAFAHEIFPLPY
jgi:hypothetical protein